MSNQGKISTTVITSAVIIFAVFLLTKMSSKKKAFTNQPPQDFPDNLKQFYTDLQLKGYEPKGTSGTNPTVQFKISEGENNLEITVNKENTIEIYYRPYSPLWIGQFKENKITHVGKVVAESSNLLDGILQLIENKDYIL